MRFERVNMGIDFERLVDDPDYWTELGAPEDATHHAIGSISPWEKEHEGGSASYWGGVCWILLSEDYRAMLQREHYRPRVERPEKLVLNMAEHTRQALLMVLYCHQGAHSRIGQEVRFILGKGQYDRMTPDEVRIAGEMLTKVVTE